MMRNLELVEMEIETYCLSYDGDNCPVIQGSALGGLNNVQGTKFLN
jgi:elongation factor Tu